MQTFLPSPSYIESAQMLDYRRLGKQRVECKQILLALRKRQGGWVNHPATKMWRGYEYELASYGACMCREWAQRGYRDSLLPFFETWAWMQEQQGDETRIPPWLGDERVHASHRSNLLRKDPKYYARFGWVEPDDMPYVWPVV